MKIARHAAISGYIRYPEMRFTHYGMAVMTWELIIDGGQVIACQAWAALAEKLAMKIPNGMEVRATCTGRTKLVEWEDKDNVSHKREVFTAVTVVIEDKEK